MVFGDRFGKKGIRVNQLAKELGVTSKAILDKLHGTRGWTLKSPNHMSVTVARPGGDGARVVRQCGRRHVQTAVETAAEAPSRAGAYAAAKPKQSADRAPKPQAPRRKKKMTTDAEAPCRA